MIYEQVDDAADYRQGDILQGVPRVDFSLSELLVVPPTGTSVVSNWDDLRDSDQVHIVVTAKPVWAIIASQDCDCVRSPYITLCEVQPLSDVNTAFRTVTTTKGFVGNLRNQLVQNCKWFYLPPSPELIGFHEKMAVDFTQVLRLRLADLQAMKRLRRGRLNPVSDEHFRERLAHFFQRFPVDDWYALTPAELAEYPVSPGSGPPTPFPWQQ